MDPYLFLCVLAIAFPVHNVYAQQQHQLMGMGQQNRGNMRRKFPGRQSAMGGGMGAGNNQQQGMNPGRSAMDMGMGGGNNMGGQGQGQGQGHGPGQSQGKGVPQGQGQGMNNMGGGGMDLMGGLGGMLGGGSPLDHMMGGMGGMGNMGGMPASLMAMNAMSQMNSEIPPHMIMSGRLNPTNFAQHRACEKTPSNLNNICDPSRPNPCPHGNMISRSLGGMGGIMGMNAGAGAMSRRRNRIGPNPFVCSSMTEHGLARCCAKNMRIARMLDKWFK